MSDVWRKMTEEALEQQLGLDWSDPGQYEHKCSRCQRTFFGGKRRVFCRKCQSPNKEVDRDE